jgi:gamma-glutamyl-gamma-aminobutyrate hydrolase PuuD
VQWHPEDRIEISDSDLKLFEAFAKHVASVMSSK